MAMNDTGIISCLKKIIDSAGVSVFENHARANALISDYFPSDENARTRKLLNSIINVDAFAKISSADNNDLDGICNAVKTILVDDESLSEDRAEMAVSWVCGALGKRKPHFTNTVQPKTQSTQSVSSGNGNSYTEQSSSKSDYSPAKRSTRQSRTVNVTSNNTYGLNLNHQVKCKKNFSNVKSVFVWIVVVFFIAVNLVCEKRVLGLCVNNELNGLDLFSDVWPVLWPSWAVVFVTLLTTTILGQKLLKDNNTYLFCFVEVGALLVFTFVLAFILPPCDTIVENIIGLPIICVILYVVPVCVSGVICRILKNHAKKLIGWTVALCILAVFAYFVVWPKMVYPNMENENFYTPEIVQAYSGTYRNGKVNGEAVVTILSCDNAGNVTGHFEFIVDNTYGKYEVTGKITKKKNNGNLELSLTPGQWIVQPKDYTYLEVMYVEISDNYQAFECPQYSMYWDVGENDEYYIKTIDDFQKLSGSEATYQLKNDIDLSDVNWKPIEGFKGTLIGNGFTIKNMTIRISDSNVGLFDSVSGSISNLKLENVDIEVQGGYENIGAICGSTSGSINGCEVTGSIKAIKCTNVGGIVGQVSSKNASISDCKNAASVEGLDNVGGVSGYIYTMFSFDFISNENTATVSGNNYVGGLLGCVAPREVGWTEMYGDNYGDLVIKKCLNSGKVTGNDYVGGMAGSFSGTSTHLGFGDYYTITASMSDSTNNATITGRDYVGGLAGYTGGYANSISNCHNNADITGNYYVGGYVGYSSRAEITDAENENTVFGKAYVGGIVGVGYSLKNCINNGVVESTGTFLSETTLLSCTGGIAGQANFVHGCVNNNDVIVETNGYYVGGIVGIIKSDAIINMDGNKNYGNVVGYSYVGGFAGAISSQPGPGDIKYYEGTLIISNVLNSGNVSATAEYAGGITGYVEGAYRHYGFGDCKNVTYQISFCNNTGDVSGTANVDGIAGKIGEYVVTDETVLNTNESTGKITIK